MTIEYTTGDATNPHLYHRTPNEAKLIIHCCNDVGAWGAGFVMALSKVDPAPQKAYQLWAMDRKFLYHPEHLYTPVVSEALAGKVSVGEAPFVLGQIQVVPFTNDNCLVSNDYVVNMIGQRNIRQEHFSINVDGVEEKEQMPPIRYDCIAECLYRVAEVASRMNASVHCPRFGCGLAGGDWGKIEPMLQWMLNSYNIPVFVYDMP